MAVLKILGLLSSTGLLSLAAFLAWSPWRVHGGRFITEYFVVSGIVAVVGLIVLVAALRWA